jgi:hypothetical protein
LWPNHFPNQFREREVYTVWQGDERVEVATWNASNTTQVLAAIYNKPVGTKRNNNHKRSSYDS